MQGSGGDWGGLGQSKVWRLRWNRLSWNHSVIVVCECLAKVDYEEDWAEAVTLGNAYVGQEWLARVFAQFDNVGGLLVQAGNEMQFRWGQVW